MTKKTKSYLIEDLTLKEGFVGQKMLAFHGSIIDISKTNDITTNFYVSDLGYYPNAHHHYRVRKKGASQYIFIYCIKGKGVIYLNDKRTEVNPNQFLIIPKKIKHEYRACENDPWSIYWFHFNGSLADKLYKRYESTQTKNHINIPFSIDKINLFEKIFNLFNNTYLENQIEYANLLSLNFISNFIYHDSEYNIKSESNDTTVNSIIKYLLNNLDKRFTLDELAFKFNYSKSYLHTKFKVKTGYPLLAFFNLKKVQKACELLNYSDLSIKEISFKVGYEDPLYFSRNFKNLMGKSPRNYRQSLRK